MKLDPEQIELVRGSGNIYRDLGYPDADVRQLKALLAAEIIKTLDREGLTVRAAQMRTGVAAADFSRIRSVDLKRFTLDRLMGIVNKLGSRMEVTLKITPARRPTTARSTELIAAEPARARYGAIRKRT